MYGADQISTVCAFGVVLPWRVLEYYNKNYSRAEEMVLSERGDCEWALKELKLYVLCKKGDWEAPGL